MTFDTTARERDRERDKEKTWITKSSVEYQYALWLRNYSELVNTTEAQEKLREIADYLEDLLE